MANVVLLGPPGAGKGTQAPIIAQAIDGGYLSSGALLRQAAREPTPVGSLVREYMSRGELVPDEIVLDLVMKHLQAQDARSGFVLDGFPRNVHQARELDRRLKAAGQRVDHAILLDVPREVLLARLRGRLSGDVEDDVSHRRADDRPEAVERRLEVYAQETEPLREYYGSRQVLTKIDGNQPMADVTRQILVALGRTPTKPGE